MRKGLAAVSLVSGLVVAGCSGGGADPAPSQPPQPQTPAAPARTAPSKSVELADKCSIITPQQAQQLGVDQPPQQTDQNGNQVCRYEKGAAGSHGGWTVNVGLRPNETTTQFRMQHQAQKVDTNVGGYPAVNDRVGKYNCLTSVDISDRGSLNIVSQVRPDPQMPDSCQIANQAAEAAVQNLPNA